MGFTAAVLGATLLVGGGAGYAISSSQDNAKEKQQQSLNDQANSQNKMLADAKAQTDQNNLDAQNTAARDAARLKQRNAATAAVGRQDTILTGPLGVPSTPQTGGKTLLGS